jgi:1-deoxy-D-xylulose-5-phosphate reductoisomerase
MSQIKKIAILGSTGSIGTQALDVVEKHPDLFEVEVLVANNSVELLCAQARKFQPNVVVVGNEAHYGNVKEALVDLSIKVYAGQEAIAQVVQMSTIDVVLVALVGFSGLKPTKCAIEAGKTIALANKETLVVAGAYIMSLAKEKGVPILPVDSEHSAIFQCLNGERHLKPSKIILTASGGPFRGWGIDELRNVTPQAALKHPNWDMGAKVTIDSASLMNKGLESIEAKWLFEVEPDDIEIVVHPQSIVHSLVEFADGSIKAQLGMPDMRLPIQYALTFPYRFECPVPKFDFLNYPQLTFEQPNREVFRNLNIAFDAMRRGGNVACLMNGANEVAVAEFLKGNISFLEMPDLIERTIEKCTVIANPSFDDYFESDKEARRIAYEQIKG